MPSGAAAPAAVAAAVVAAPAPRPRSSPRRGRHSARAGSTAGTRCRFPLHFTTAAILILNPKRHSRRGCDSEDENEGFGNWLRSSDGVAYMRLFVVANSLLVFMTMSWSHVWHVVDIVREMIGF